MSTEPKASLGGDGAKRSEPVAWRWRNKPDGVWNYQEARQRIPDVEQQPLYAAPVLPVEVREEIARIVWEKVSPTAATRAWVDVGVIGRGSYLKLADAILSTITGGA